MGAPICCPACGKACGNTVDAAARRTLRCQFCGYVEPRHTVSVAFAEFLSLAAAAASHKEHCAGENCTVSLYLLKKTGIRLTAYLPNVEYLQAQKILETWPEN